MLSLELKQEFCCISISLADLIFFCCEGTCEQENMLSQRKIVLLFSISLTGWFSFVYFSLLKKKNRPV